MSLTYDISKIKDHTNVCWIGEAGEIDDREMNPVTQALIFATMSVDLGSITEANWTEFAIRVDMHENALGTFLRDGAGEKRFITADEVRAHIGLSTNVTNLSKAAFHGKLVKNLRREAEFTLRQQMSVPVS